ncbi:MAG: YfiR family protein [Pseudomonadota bacterium]
MLQVLAWFGVAGWGYAQAQAGVPDAQLIRAAYLYNFAKFTTWPDVPRRDGRLSLCVAGTDALTPALQALGGRLVRGRFIAVHPVRGADLPDTCQMLYVAASDVGRATALLRQARGLPLLTLSAQQGFAEAGGMVELTEVGGRTRFIINLGAARAVGLEISPSLLSLSEVVGH